MRDQRLERSLTVEGRRRSYYLDIPGDLRPMRQVPVILAFHGGSGNPVEIAKVTRLSERAVPLGFVVAYPGGYKNTWNAGDCCGPARDEGIDDVGFVRAILADLEAMLRVDHRRIFATGFSNGGKLAYRLACELSDRIAAIGVVATSLGVTDRTPNRPVSILHFHGTADRLAPFSGGRGMAWSSVEQVSVPSTIALWVQWNRCSGEARITREGERVMRFSYPSHHEGAQVVLYLIQGMGHQWPGGKALEPGLLGPGSDDLSATDKVIEFFLAHAGGRTASGDPPKGCRGRRSRRVQTTWRSLHNFNEKWD